MSTHFSAVPHETPITKHQLGETETYILQGLVAKLLSHDRPSVALLSKEGSCFAVLMTPVEYNLLQELEKLAANPAAYRQVQDEADQIEAHVNDGDFVPAKMVFDQR